MEFAFGTTIRTKMKDVNSFNRVCLLKDSFKENKKYFLFLTESIIHKSYLDLLIKDIEKSGIQSYCIVSSVSVKKIEDDSTKNLLTLESSWKDYLERGDKRVDAIIAFGSAIRVLNKSGDVNWYDFIADKFFEPRYWCGKEFVDGPDCWIYTSADISHVYPAHPKNPGKPMSNSINWTTRFFQEQLKRIQKDDLSSKSLDMRDYKIIIPKDREESSAYLRTLINSDLLAVDIETNGLHFMKDELGRLQLSRDGETAYFFDWKFVDKRLLNQVLKSAKRTTLANGKFDTKFLWKNGISRDWYQTDDIILLSHAMHSDRPKGLKPAAIFWCGKFTGYDLSLDKEFEKSKDKNFLNIDPSILSKYAALDVIVTWRVQKALDKRVKWIDENIPNEKIPEWTIENWYKKVMIPNTQMITEVEFEGVYVDREQFKKSKILIEGKIKELKDILIKEWSVKSDFQFESTTELGKQFERMGWPKIKESKAKGFKTSDEVLIEYEAMNMPGIKTLKDLRSYLVGLSTFIVGWEKHIIDYEDGTSRIHPNCNCFGTKSYRHSMRDPNFQQLPSGAIIAPLIKKLFTVPGNDKDNWFLCEADFASLQMRLGFQDEGINPKGVDSIAYELYGPQGHGDSHSQTAFNVFHGYLGQDIIEIVDENNKKIIFTPEQKIKIKRKNLSGEPEEMIIKGLYFIETDEWCGYV